jgi:putative hydrolase of the HAD superfamily
LECAITVKRSGFHWLAEAFARSSARMPEGHASPIRPARLSPGEFSKYVQRFAPDKQVLSAFARVEVLMIEAVIWDFGGVLTSSPFEAFARFENERGLPADIIRRTNANNHWENAWAKFERAEVDLEIFDRLFAEESLALGAEVRGKDVLPLLSGDLRPEMVEALRVVKSRFKTGCITNNLPANAIGSGGGRSMYVAEVMALFDHIIESAKIGLRKPDPRIYRMMTEALGVDPKACVYLDDLGVNLKPARDMGMTTIKVVNAPQAITELEAATGLSLR